MATDKDKLINLARITDDTHFIRSGRLVAWGKRFSFSDDGDITRVERQRIYNNGEYRYTLMGEA